MFLFREMDEITTFIKGAISDNQCLGRCLYIHGVPGTGKVLSSRTSYIACWSNMQQNFSLDITKQFLFYYSFFMCVTADNECTLSDEEFEVRSWCRKHQTILFRGDQWSEIGFTGEYLQGEVHKCFTVFGFMTKFLGCLMVPTSNTILGHIWSVKWTQGWMERGSPFAKWEVCRREENWWRGWPTMYFAHWWTWSSCNQKPVGN